MMPLAITLNEHATIAHAAAMMSLEDFHHVMVVASDHALLASCRRWTSPGGSPVTMASCRTDSC